MSSLAETLSRARRKGQQDALTIDALWAAIERLENRTFMSARWARILIPYTVFDEAGASPDPVVLTLPSGTWLHRYILKHSESFAGGAISAATAAVTSITNATSLLAYAPALDVFQAPGNTPGTHFKHAAIEAAVDRFDAAAVTITLALTGGTGDQLTAGLLELWVEVSRPTVVILTPGSAPVGGGGGGGGSGGSGSGDTTPISGGGGIFAES